MTAIIAGAGWGLENTSARILGARGLLGTATQGRGGDQVYVNAATGNLVVQKADELLIGRGPDAQAVRTYNSLGQMSDDNGDNWRMSAQRSVVLTGTLNTTGSTVTLTGWDGAVTVFVYDAAFFNAAGASRYISAAGDGAYDVIVSMTTPGALTAAQQAAVSAAGAAGNSWVWIDGATQTIDAFDGANGKIAKSFDLDGNALSYFYGANGQISEVRTANGESTFYDYYSGTNNLSQVRTVVGAQELTRVRYAYDASNRLTTVTIDLSPDDNSIADGETYVTTYTYDGTSRRVASITQTDGSSLAILYDGSGRVSQLTQTAATGVTRVTTFAYNAAARTTTITDALGQETVLYYDDADAPSQLTRIVPPPVGGVSQDVRFDYNSRGDVASATDALNNTTTFGYDAAGNLIFERDSAGNTITRTYGASNELLTETRYTTPNPAGVDPPPPLPPLPPVPPPPPPDGLIAAYSLDEGSGGIINNSVSTNYQGTFSGTPTWSTSGQHGGALVFDGSDYVSLGAMPEVSGATKLTIGAWMKRNAANARVFAGVDWNIGLLLSTDGSLSVPYGSGSTIASAGALNDTNWHYVALVFDGTQTENADRLKVYIDGNAATLTFTGTPPATIPTTTESFELGRLASFYSNGMIDDVRIYNRTLTQAEVQADMATPVPPPPPPPPPPPGGLVAAYNLDEGTGSVINNSASTNYQGTFSGTPTWSTSGQHLGALILDSGDHVSLGAMPEISGATKVTIGAWMKRNAANARVFLGVDWKIGLLLSTDGTLSIPYGSSSTLASAGALNDTNWHYVTLVFDGTQTNNDDRLKVYIDGNAATLSFTGTVPATIPTTTEPFELGRLDSFYSNGMIDDVRIYNRTLTQAEVQADMATPVEPPSTPPPAPPTGKYGQALMFGSGDHVRVPGGISEIAGVSAVTIGAWMKRSAPGEAVRLGNAESGTDNLQIELRNDGTLTVGAHAGGAGGYGSVALNDTNWHYIVLVFDGNGVDNASRLKAYVDGVLQTLTFTGGTIGTTTCAADDFRIGRVQGNSSNGLIDEVRIYNRALNAAEIAADGDTPISVSAGQSGIVAAYAFDEGSGTSADNAASASSAYNGTFLGTPEWVAAPASGLTTRYVYDSEKHLRYVVSAEGRVTEFKYNAAGLETARITYAANSYSVSALSPSSALNEAQLDSWVAGISDKSGSLRTDTTYDALGRGAIADVTTYGKVNADGTGYTGAGAENVKIVHVYDQAGQLLQRQPVGSASSEIYVYDGMGRIKLSTDLKSATTSIVFDDSNRQTVTTLASGLVQTAQYNKAGELISVTESGSGMTSVTTSYFYDAFGRLRYTEDPTGVRTHRLYDAAGRTIAEIDADGSLTEYKYNLRNELVATVRYKNLLSTTQFDSLVNGSGEPQNVTLASVLPATDAADRWEWRIHDAAGRLIETIDAQGAATMYTYDAADRLLQTTRHANLIAGATVSGFKTTPPATLQTPTADAANDRATRYFYDSDNLLIATLDGEGGFTQTVYDKAGQKVETIAYASAVAPALREGGTFGQLLASVTDAAIPAAVRATDIHNYFVYDSRGLLRASVNGEGEITRYRYNQFGGLDQEERGRKLDPAQLLITPPTLASVAAASGPVLEVTDYVRAADGRILSRTLTVAGGTEATTFDYDVRGRVIKETAAANIAAETRITQRRYDLQGRLIGELNGEGSAWLASNPTQIDQAYATYGIRYEYDSAGRLKSTIAPNGVDAQGNRTLYYYDKDGSLRFVINALGEVTEYRYDNFGGRADQIDYGTRVSPTTLATLVAAGGGLVTTAVTNAAAGIADVNKDSKRHIDYNVTGTIAASFDAANFQTSFTYNAFGQEIGQTSPVSTGVTVQTTKAYDRRGLLASTILDSGGLALTTSVAYDAFGRALSVTDPRGIVRQTGYDRAGRIIVLTDGLGATEQMTYDARGNVVTRTDRRGYTTAYSYNAFNRSITTTTAEGVVATVTTNPHGQTLSITDPRGAVTTYEYNKNGSVKKVTRTGGGTTQETTKTYDTAGRLYEAIDERGFKTRFSYDAANRVLSRIVDSAAGGLALTTLFEYDAKGQVVKTTDPSGVVTQVTYDLKGQKTQVAVDPTGINSVTTFDYDQRGRVLTMTEGAGAANPKVTQYTFDKADRLTKTQINPAGLDITTQYAYDAVGNAVAKTDANGFVTRYVYDAENRLIYSVDPVGGVRRNVYDANGNVTNVIAHANAISLTTPTALPLAISVSDITSRLTTSTANDQRSVNVYDKDGRLRYAVDALGYVDEFVYDSAGAVVRRVSYKNAVALPSLITADNAASASSTYNGTYFGTPERTETGKSGGGLVFGSGDYVRIDSDITEIKNASAVTISAWMKRAAPGAAVRLGKAESGNDNLQIELASNGTLTVGAHSGGSGAYGSVALNDTAWHHITLVFDGSGADNASRLKAYVDGVLQTLTFTGGTIGTTTTGTSDQIRIGRVQGASSNGMIDEARIYGRALSATEIATDRDTPIATSPGASGIVAAFGFDEGANELAFIQAALVANSEDRATRAVYDGLGREAFTIDATGAVTKRAFDAAGNVTKETRFAALYQAGGDPPLIDMQNWATTNANAAQDRVTNFAYDNAGRLAYVVDAEKHVEERRYDAAGRLTKSVLHAQIYSGATTYAALKTAFPPTATPPATAVEASYHYDTAGRLYETVDSLGNVTRLALDRQGRITDATKAFGTADASTTHFVYDPAGRVTDEQRAYGTTAQSNTHYEYDDLGNRVRVVDPRGNDSFFYYDQLGRVVLHVDQERYATATTYTFTGQIDSVTRYANKATGTFQIGTPPTLNLNAAADAVTSFEYDKLNRLTRTTDAEAFYEQYTLDAFGDRRIVRNKLGGLTNNTFDKLGRLVEEILPIKAFNLDGAAEVSSVTGVEFITNRFEYDAFGNRTETIEAVGHSEQRTTTFEYDLANRLKKTIGDVVGVYDSATDSTASSVAPTEELFYDRRGNVIERKDAAGARTLFWYDELNRITHTVSPTGTLTRHFYDARGNLTERRTYATRLDPLPPDATGAAPSVATHADDRQIFYVYDKLDRLEQTQTPNITTAAFGTSFAVTTGTLTTIYEYNAAGQVVKTTDANGGVVFSYYDKVGRKTVEIDAGNYRSDWTYDAEGNVVSERRYATASAAPAGTANPPGAPATTADDRVTDFTYDRMGRRLTETRLGVKVHNGSGDHVVQDATIVYTYNALGQVKTKAEATGDTTTYTYDSGGRLVNEKRAAHLDHQDLSVIPETEYFYDGLGNLVRTRAKGSTNTIQRVTVYAYGAGGRLATMTEAYNSAIATYDETFTRTYRHDAAGRVVRDEYYRVAADNSIPEPFHEAMGYEYDLEGRVLMQGVVVDESGVWTRDLLGPNNGKLIDTAVMKYNAFGEVSERGINDLYAEKFDYDRAGRVWRTNTGDGTWKYLIYDGVGNQTLMVASVGMDLFDKTLIWVLDRWGTDRAAIGTGYVETDGGVAATITVYDKRNQATVVRQPKRELSSSGPREDLITQRVYSAFGDVISETNAAGFTIDYTYNTMGHRIKTESPQVSITLEDGTVQNVRPTEQSYYDVSGRLVASRDANGNLTRMVLLAGSGYGGTQVLATKVTTADNAEIDTGYDVHGDAREITDQLDRVKTQTFDRRGRLIEVTQAGGLEETYKYDGLNQRIRSWNNVLTSVNGERNFYDQQGRVIKHVSMGGDETTYAYEWDPTIVSDVGAYGGWRQRTVYDNQLLELNEKTELFGRMTYKEDLGGHETFFTYDKAGRLIKRDGAPTDASAIGLNYAYFDTGRMASVFTDVMVPADLTQQAALYLELYANVRAYSFMDMAWGEGDPDHDGDKDIYDFALRHYAVHGIGWGYVNPANLVSQRQTTYAYDKAGNVVEEKFVDIGLTDQAGKHPIYTDAHAEYDALGRLVHWEDRGSEYTGDGAHTPPASIDYKYDAVGNIRNSYSTFLTLDAQGYVAGSETHQDYWYRYDSLNRVVTQKGEFDDVNDVIVRGTQGVDIAYDFAGQRAYVLKTQAGGVIITREDYVYDNGGRLDQVLAGQSAWNGSGWVDPTGLGGANPSALRADFQYDLMGRLTHQWDYQANGTTVAFDRSVSWNANSQMTEDHSITRRGSDLFYSDTTYDYRDEFTDYALGAPVYVITWTHKNSESATGKTTHNFYQWWDGPMQSSINVTGGIVSTYSYQNVGGGPQLSSVRVEDGRPHTIAFRTDLTGQIIKRDEGDMNTPNPAYGPDKGDPHEIWYRFNGRQMGYVGNNGTLDTNYVSSIDARTDEPGSGGAFRNNEPYGSVAFDFDQSVSPLNSYYQGSTGGSYTVREGDTLASIAQNLWGDSTLWYKLAEVNGLSSEVPLFEGQVLVLPTGVVKSHHNFSTFTPYEQADIIGDTGPAVPRAKKNKCGVVGQILLAVIAVVVTIYTGGAASAAFGPILGGAIGGAAGSIASQAVGVATGIQRDFSWNAVALGAIGGAISGGLSTVDVLNGGASMGARVAQTTARGAISNAATQAVGDITGWQREDFSWAGVAGAGVGAGFAQFASDVLPGAAIYNDNGDILQGATWWNKGIANAASATANAATRSLIEGSEFENNLRAAIPDVIAQTVGDAVGDRIRESALSRALEKGMMATADFLGFDGRFGWQGPSDDRSFSLFGLGDAFESAATPVLGAVGDVLGFDGQIGWQGPSDDRSFSLAGLGDALQGAGASILRAVGDFTGLDGQFGWQGPLNLSRSFSLDGLGEAFGRLGGLFTNDPPPVLSSAGPDAYYDEGWVYGEDLPDAARLTTIGPWFPNPLQMQAEQAFGLAGNDFAFRLNMANERDPATRVMLARAHGSAAERYGDVDGTARYLGLEMQLRTGRIERVGATDLSETALRRRASTTHPVYDGQNVVVVEYEDSRGRYTLDGKRVSRITFVSQRSGEVGVRSTHAEEFMQRWLRNNEIQPDRVTRVYSDRSPCAETCRAIVAQYRRARVTWAVDHPDDVRGRQAATRELVGQIRGYRQSQAVGTLPRYPWQQPSVQPNSPGGIRPPRPRVK